jgi:hypothetical protein
MTIRIDEFTRGRFGNRILQYNNMMQLAYKYDLEPSCVDWEGNNIFKNLVGEKESHKPKRLIGTKEILSPNNGIVSLYAEDCVIDVGAMNTPIHNTFYHLTKVDPRNFFQINDKYKKELPGNIINIGIHFRGTDKHRVSQGREVRTHPPLYYKNAIKIILNKHKNKEDIKFYIGTDDRHMKSYIDTVNFLGSEGLEYDIGSDNQFEDFATLSECDYLIGSSSTFVICAGFIGKKNKKIIHSLEWLKLNVEHIIWDTNVNPPEHVREWQLQFDNFFVDLHNGGNEYCNIWRAV